MGQKEKFNNMSAAEKAVQKARDFEAEIALDTRTHPDTILSMRDRFWDSQKANTSIAVYFGLSLDLDITEAKVDELLTSARYLTIRNGTDSQRGGPVAPTLTWISEKRNDLQYYQSRYFREEIMPQLVELTGGVDAWNTTTKAERFKLYQHFINHAPATIMEKTFPREASCWDFAQVFSNACKAEPYSLWKEAWVTELMEWLDIEYKLMGKEDKASMQQRRDLWRGRKGRFEALLKDKKDGASDSEYDGFEIT